jgi:ketosteroid isomerase-like protein
MQRVFVLLILAASYAGLLRAQATPSDQADEKIKQEILQFADEQNHAVTTADMETLKRIFADDLAYTNERGKTLTKPERLAELGSGKRKVSHMNHDDIQVFTYGDTVVVTGRSRSNVAYQGGSSTAPRRFMCVYVKHDGQWQVVAQQETPVAEP